MPQSAVKPHLSGPGVASARVDAKVAVTSWAVFWRKWWLLGLGVAALLGSTAIRFSQSFWQQSDYEHSPILLVVALGLLWRERAAIFSAQTPVSAAGASALILFGLLAYLFGVRIKAGFLEFGALLPIIAGALWLIGDWPLVRRCWFALLFLFLAMPLPANVIVAMTAELKEWVSQAAEAILHLAGYPIARDGVTLRIGPYNLLLADACSGLNSLISLSAVGLAYQHIIARRRGWHATILLGSIVPIAVATNIVRVIILTLITYHLGDEAGQGFLHEFAGFAMFLIALATLAFLDVILGTIFLVAHGGQNAGH